jgi:hypothetical protein
MAFSFIIQENGQMRWLSRLLVVLIFCIIAVTVPAVPAQAMCVPWGIELSPKSGPPGTEVTVYGHDFTEGRLVDIRYDGTLVATGRSDSGGDFTITFTVPEGCTGPYEVEADVGYTTVHTYFSVKPGLTVSPEKGPTGTTVAVKGQGFAKNEEDIELMYYTNDSYETIGRRIRADAQGSWETSFQIPPSIRGEHKIDAQGDVSRAYEVVDTIFRVTAEISIDKSSGIMGDTITMTGNRFTANEKNIKILFGGEAVVTGIKANSKGEWEASFEVPDMSTGNYSVTAEGEWTRQEDITALSFEIKPYIVLSATAGYVGMDLTVTGYGFAANEDIVITYDGSPVATAETDDKGNFEANFPVPESRYGERVVAAGYSGENHANDIFTMESDPPPIPQLVSPENRSRLRFTGKVAPTFEWSAVSDDSGVRYSLQIATSADVTAAGEFVDPLVSVEVLAETSYTLAETDALPYGTYYWIVQAVDGAENESGWTAAHSFQVGLLPRWGLIAIIVAAAVLFIALIRALVRRRTIYYDRW